MKQSNTLHFVTLCCVVFLYITLLFHLYPVLCFLLCRQGLIPPAQASLPVVHAAVSSVEGLPSVVRQANTMTRQGRPERLQTHTVVRSVTWIRHDRVSGQPDRSCSIRRSAVSRQYQPGNERWTVDSPSSVRLSCEFSRIHRAGRFAPL